MDDLFEGVLTEFVDASHRAWWSGSDERYWAAENMTIGHDHNTAQAAYMRAKWKFDGLHRRKARDYMRDYNKRPERMAKRRAYEAARRKRKRAMKEA